MVVCDDDDGDEVPVVTIRGPSPQKPNGKGKEKVLEGDVDMLEVEESRGRLREAGWGDPRQRTQTQTCFFSMMRHLGTRRTRMCSWRSLIPSYWH